MTRIKIENTVHPTPSRQYNEYKQGGNLNVICILNKIDGTLSDIKRALKVTPSVNANTGMVITLIIGLFDIKVFVISEDSIARTLYVKSSCA